jgi:hypothetical protein
MNELLSLGKSSKGDFAAHADALDAASHALPKTSRRAVDQRVPFAVWQSRHSPTAESSSAKGRHLSFKTRR